MFMRSIRPVAVMGLFDLRRRNLSVLARQSKNFMAARLNSTGFMNIDMSGLRASAPDTGEVPRRSRSDWSECLPQEMDVHVLPANYFLDTGSCLFAVRIFPYPTLCSHIRIYQFLKDGRMRSFHIIILKHNHSLTLLSVLLILITLYNAADCSAFHANVISISHFPDIYISCAKKDAPTTVKSPAVTIARLPMAPSTSPISMALAVPIAWEAVPRASPFAIGWRIFKIL